MKQEKSLQLLAHAKINLTLDVLRRREDGYHEVKMVMQQIGLHDTVSVCLALDAEPEITLRCDCANLPTDELNLAHRAAALFLQQTGEKSGAVTIEIEKHIPVAAGLAGGSTDAAAVLRALNTLCGGRLDENALCALGLRLGADVPFCIRGGAMLAEGIGEKLTPLPSAPNCHVLLCKIPASVSTKDIYERIDSETRTVFPDTNGMLAALGVGDLPGVCARLANVMEPVCAALHPKILVVKEKMLACGALGACMSGSGPTVFGLFREEENAKAAEQMLKAQYPETFLTTMV